MNVVPFLVPFAAAYLTCVLLGPWASRAGRRLKAIDQPERLKMHREPVSRSGGLAIGAGLLVGGWAGAPLAGIFDQAELLRLAGVTLAAGVMFLVGFLDDVMDLAPRQKLAAQFIPPTLLVMLGLGLGQHHPLYMAAPITFVIVLSVVNALNLLDGMDGIAAGTTVIAALTLAAFLGAGGSPLAATWALALAGAAAGFLTLNFHPATLFMGDGGSFLCGFGLAFSTLEVLDRSFSPRTMAAVLLILAVPVVDTGLTAGRRILSGRPLTVADGKHTYHILFRSGLTQRGVFTVFAVTGGVLGAAALVVGEAPVAVIWLAGGCAASAVLIVLFRPMRARIAGRPSLSEVEPPDRAAGF